MSTLLKLGAVNITSLILCACSPRGEPTHVAPPKLTSTVVTATASPASAPHETVDPLTQAVLAQAAEGERSLAKERKNANVARGASDWRYDTETDKMTGTTSRFAFLSSDNQFDFGFPYSGGSRADLMVRKRTSDGLTVLFSISKGQIVCSPSCTVRVRFDGKSPIAFTATGPADYSSTSLFLSPAGRFVAELAKSKKALVEVSYYHSGSKVSEFTTAGFEWEK